MSQLEFSRQVDCKSLACLEECLAHHLFMSNLLVKHMDKCEDRKLTSSLNRQLYLVQKQAIQLVQMIHLLLKPDSPLTATPVRVKTQTQIKTSIQSSSDTSIPAFQETKIEKPEQLDHVSESSQETELRIDPPPFMPSAEFQPKKLNRKQRRLLAAQRLKESKMQNHSD